MAKYKIWDKVTPVITPIGEMLSPEEWMERYPVAMSDNVKIVCDGSDINGAFFGVLSAMKDAYEQQGCDFSACKTDQDVLDCIEAWELFINIPDDSPTTEERTAAALEFIAVNSLPDTEQATN